MQERLENCINKFQMNIKNAKSKQNLFFGKKNTADKFARLNHCLRHLESYKDETLNLIEKNRENKDYFEAHRAAVVNLLEQVENRKFNFHENDFKLVIPQTSYKETNLHTFNSYLGVTFWGVLSLSVACAVASIIAGCIVFPPGALFTLAAGAGAVFLGLLIAGLVLACIAGIAGIVNHCIDSSLECEEKYLKGSAFDTDLIMGAYAILYKETGKACNQDIELGEQDRNEANFI
ncbi:MAG: hypothetical protein H0U70_10225 [Tatlockia sp.]|nr:hypothetical protein [Tatlockia sp.]